MIHTAGAYPGVPSVKQFEVFHSLWVGTSLGGRGCWGLPYERDKDGLLQIFNLTPKGDQSGCGSSLFDPQKIPFLMPDESRLPTQYDSV